MAYSHNWQEYGVNLGDVVLIADKAKLERILQVFSPTLESIAPFTIKDITDQYGTVVDIKSFNDPSAEYNFFAIVLLENGCDVALPLQAFEVMQMEVLEASDEDPYAKLREVKNKVNSHQGMSSLGSLQEQALVYSLAAESIQAAYRYVRISWRLHDIFSLF
jgi:hypothetical protein